MKLKVRPEDFRVEELIKFPEGPARFAYYRVEKMGIPTPLAQVLLARALGVAPREVFFPALKDSRAVAIQYASVPKGNGLPLDIRHEGLRAKLVGTGPRRLEGRDLLGNRFRLVIRGLDPTGAHALAGELRRLEKEGFPNYFDEQRFGSLSPKGSPGKAILLRDAEAAVRFYLAEELRGDPRAVREFKALAREHWGDWEALLREAPRPSNFRSVLAYLRDHPGDFRRALNLIPPRLVSLFLSAYQSLLWNRILGRWLVERSTDNAWLEIAGEEYPIPRSLPGETLALLGKLSLPLPHLRAAYPGEWGRIAREVLAEEGLDFKDLKARIVERAYLSKASRPVWCFPREVEIGGPQPDALHPGHTALEVSFSLPPGSYGTLYVRAAWSRVSGGRGLKG